MTKIIQVIMGSLIVIMKLMTRSSYARDAKNSRKNKNVDLNCSDSNEVGYTLSGYYTVVVG